MKVILVCVDYSDLLSITLPYNRHHFSDVLVVTTHTDTKTHAVAHENGAQLFLTDAFYRNGANFNKWLALEEGLDSFGREGWLCIMDADVLWPKVINFYTPFASHPIEGNLYTPRRRMWSEWPNLPPFSCYYSMKHKDTCSLPVETNWTSFPLHPQQTEFAGYTQIFHASDPVLGPAPWHQTNWKHAGGADSFFQEKWPAERKVRPPFEVLHLGPAGQNWAGRSTAYLDGTTPADAMARRERLRAYLRGRTQGPTRFDGERF